MDDMSEQFWLGLWRTVGVTLVSIVLVMGGCSMYRTNQFVQGGYHSCVLPGSNDTVWCK